MLLPQKNICIETNFMVRVSDTARPWLHPVRHIFSVKTLRQTHSVRGFHFHTPLINYRWISGLYICSGNTSRVSRSNDNREEPPHHTHTHTHTHTHVRSCIHTYIQNSSTGKTPLSPRTALWGWSAAVWRRLTGRQWTRPGPLRTIPLRPSSAALSRSLCAPRGSTLPAPRQDGCAAALRCRDGSCAYPEARGHGARKGACSGPTCPRGDKPFRRNLITPVDLSWLEHTAASNKQWSV